MILTASALSGPEQGWPVDRTLPSIGEGARGVVRDSELKGLRRDSAAGCDIRPGQPGGQGERG